MTDKYVGGRNVCQETDAMSTQLHVFAVEMTAAPRSRLTSVLASISPTTLLKATRFADAFIPLIFTFFCESLFTRLVCPFELLVTFTTQMNQFLKNPF